MSSEDARATPKPYCLPGSDPSTERGDRAPGAGLAGPALPRRILVQTDNAAGANPVKHVSARAFSARAVRPGPIHQDIGAAQVPNVPNPEPSVGEAAHEARRSRLC
jgi:hypothetical protein